MLLDGRMETTWKLLPNVKWQDGTPLTSADLVFTAQVGQDKDLVLLGDVAFDSIERVEAPDPSTVLVPWAGQPLLRHDRVGQADGRPEVGSSTR